MANKVRALLFQHLNWLAIVLLTISAGTKAASQVLPPPASCAPEQLSSGVKIGHVFVIVLENESFSSTFGPGSPAVYLNKTLVPQGALLQNYFGIGHVSLDNYVAMVSGQSPNPATQTDCQIYFDFVSTGLFDANGQAIGQGCVYPSSVMTLSNQLESASVAWRGYMEDMGNDLARDGSATCAHPALNSRDMTQTAEAADQYATRHDPFVYFHSIIDNNTNCSAHVVPLTPLATDLASLSTTPEFVFITPNLCHDGHDAPCTNGEPGGLVSADKFLAQTVPAILNSPAYNRDGLLAIIFDEAATSDASSCCNEQSGPNTVLPGITGPGGGRTGAVLLSKYIAPGTVSSAGYNHYALLRTIEDVFGQSHLGFACQSGLAPFGSDVFTHRMAN